MIPDSLKREWRPYVVTLREPHRLEVIEQPRVSRKEKITIVSVVVTAVALAYAVLRWG